MARVPGAIPARVLGVVTIGYSVAVLARPEVLAGPLGFADASGDAPQDVAVLCRAISGRDVVSGAAMALAPSRSTLLLAIGVRVGCDVVDAVLFGSLLPDPETRTKAVLVASGFGALCALSALPLRRRRVA
ncbi:hypothetical protein GIY23_19500 [Allosaccharopolyspora coralli]|uniref:DUF4267 domain-containing protein n=1 Tax=Allosaccharopolyspora coralli TaxID=2665642 RepID=A0A5Q3QIP9_9PSEU|nr:hypothetical protein [Allosaccharopolyspora coralli]QGK71405.1 hypothetical protein GIY23_19500 [Allosaccharopolyspora coralli]